MRKMLATLTAASILAVPAAALARDSRPDPASAASQAPLIAAQAEDPNGLGATAGQGSGQRGPYTDSRYENIDNEGGQ